MRKDYREYLEPWERAKLERFELLLSDHRAEITKLSQKALVLRRRGTSRRYLEEKTNGT